MLPPDKVDRRAAVTALPPMVKGYLRLGCYIGDGAVIDFQFGTIDICIVLTVEQVTTKYRQRYEGGTGDPADRRPS